MADINLTAAEVATIILSVGNVKDLNTTDTSSIVAACNEILNKAESGSDGTLKDMTDDYEASGATSVQQWATMAKNGSPSVYRVNEGQYVVSPSDDWRSYVSITSDGDGMRYVTVRQYSDESFFYVYVWCTGAAGGEPQRVAYFSNEGELNFIDDYDYLLPYAAKADAGKFLRIGASGTPTWQALTNVAEEGA